MTDRQQSDIECHPTVTVAIPFLGSRSYLREAVESVLAQECAQWRLVVCEDARGEEGIDRMLAAYGDPRITHVRSGARLGIAGIFNRCLDSADTELVSLLHHDDRLRPTYVACMLAAADRYPQAAAYFCRANVIDARGRPCCGLRDLAKRLLEPRFPRGERVLQGASAATALLRANFIVGPSMCFRRSRLADRRFDPRWKQVLDFELTMRLLIEGEVLVGLPEAAYVYRRHAQQTTAQNLRRSTFFTEQATLFDELAEQAQRLGWAQAAGTARARRIIKLDLACQTAGNVLRLQLSAAAARFQLLRRISQAPIAIETTTSDSFQCLWCDAVGSERSWQGVSDRLGFVPGKWNFRRCANCGSLQLDPLPSPELLPSFYPACYDPELPSTSVVRSSNSSSTHDTPLVEVHDSEATLDSTAGGTAWTRIGQLVRQLEHTLFFKCTYRLQARRLLHAIAAMTAGASAAMSPSQSRMLDIGCGRGLRMAEFHRRGFRVEGVDFQLESVRHVRQQLRLPAYQMDVHEIREKWPLNSFDLITAFYVLEHVHELESLARSCWNLLRPGGALVVAVPLADSWQARLFGSRWSQVTEAPRHLSLPTRAGVQRLVNRAGFAETRILSESILGCSAMAGLSVVPNAAATYGAKNPGARAFALRAAGAAAAAIWLPWTAAEIYLGRRPAAGLAVAIKPPANYEQAPNDVGARG